MDILEVRQLVTEALRKCEGFDRLLPLGNVVYAHVDGIEYELVIRTVRPGMSKPITNPDRDDGPVAQE